MSNFIDELCSLINRHSLENGSNTPDYLLAGYLKQCLDTFNSITQQREMWHGRQRSDMHDDPFGIWPEDDDPEPNPDCPPQTYVAYDIRGAKSLPAMMRREKRKKANSLDYAQSQHFDNEQAKSGIEALMQHKEPGWRGHANALRNEVRRLDDGDKLRALGQMRGLLKALEEEAGVVIDGNGDYHRAWAVQNASIDTLTIGDDEDQSVYERMKDLTSNERLRDAMESSDLRRKASAALIACVDAFAAMLPERSRKHTFEARDALYAALFPRETPKGHCMLCNNTGWVLRNADGSTFPGMPFSHNYKPCPENCDGGRGFSDPIPDYDMSIGLIIPYNGTEDDGA